MNTVSLLLCVVVTLLYSTNLANGNCPDDKSSTLPSSTSVLDVYIFYIMITYCHERCMSHDVCYKIQSINIHKFHNSRHDILTKC